MLRNDRNLQGITLIEVVIYLALFAMFFIVLINFYFFVSDSNQLSGENLKIDRSVILLTQHLDDSFNDAETIGSTASFGNLIGELYLEGTRNVNYTVSSPEGAIQFNDSSATYQLTRSDLEVTKFLLEEINDNSDTLIGVKVTIEITSKIKNSIKTEFSNSYLLE